MDVSSEWNPQVNEDFRMNLISTLLSSPIQLAKFTCVSNLDMRTQKSVEKDLAKKPVEKWESILSYLALPSDSSSKDVSKTTKQLFQHIEFTKDGGKAISSKGFQFLLLGRVEQMWSYLVHYLKMLEGKDEDSVVAVVEFLARLMLCVPQSMLDPGLQQGLLAYQIDQKWPNSVTDFLQHLRKLGIIHMR